MAEGYICPICSKSFTKMCSLRRHIKNFTCSCKIEITEEERPLFDVEEYINITPYDNYNIIKAELGSLCSLGSTRNK